MGRSWRYPELRRSRCKKDATSPRVIRNRLRGRATKEFKYVDKGNLATIGRSKAVADIKGVRLAGFPAWVTWLVVHLFYLIGFQNRLLVVTRWVFSFVTHGRGARHHQRDQVTRRCGRLQMAPRRVDV